jgi:hypothetical protein
MMLGDILRKFDDPAVAEAALLQLGDLVLRAQVAKAAERFGETPCEYAVASIARFSGEAKDDDWVTLMSGMGRTENPGSICLLKMLQWAVALDLQPHAGCSCGHAHSASDPNAGADI